MRTLLIEELIKSLNVPIQEDIDDLGAAESERRVSEAESGKVKSIPGEKVFKDVKSRFGN